MLVRFNESSQQVELNNLGVSSSNVYLPHSFLELKQFKN